MASWCQVGRDERRATALRWLGTGMSLRIDELQAALFGETASRLSERCGAWMRANERFTLFAEQHRDKIRKKVRGLHGDEQGLRDLELELAVAYRLLGERRFTLAYEQYVAEKTRGPDFTVTFKTHTAFNVEVKRLRSAKGSPGWASAICDKLRQIPPSMPNVLALGAEASAADALDLEAVMASIRASAERKDSGFFARFGVTSASEFFRYYGRLSALLAFVPWDSEPTPRGALWVNPQAKHLLSPELRNALAAL